MAGVEIEPEPSELGRGAILEALRRASAVAPTDRAPGRGAWWRTGVEENVLGGSEERPPDG